ncbi:hypothetical protein [Paenibacillus agricola]|nr:hypothetical protein [Paenibacillus agricola]
MDFILSTASLVDHEAHWQSYEDLFWQLGTEFKGVPSICSSAIQL